MDSFAEMNQSAISDAARLSTNELFYKVNSVNIFANPLIYTACTEELKRRICSMSKSDLLSFYEEYASAGRTDAKDILVEELRKRGYEFYDE